MKLLIILFWLTLYVLCLGFISIEVNYKNGLTVKLIGWIDWINNTRKENKHIKQTSLLRSNTSKHKGKVISHFEDQYGNVLKDLYMLDAIVIFFEDGSSINIQQDWRGNECYFSERKYE